MGTEMKRVKELICDNDLTIKKVAEDINIPRTTLNNYINGRTDAPIEIWITLAEYFNTTLDYLTQQTNNPTNENFTEGMTKEDIKELKHYRELLKIKRKIENNPKLSTYENTKQ